MISLTKARIHGYLCADGCVKFWKETKMPSTHYDIRFATSEKALAEVFRKSIEEEYGFIPSLYPPSSCRQGYYEVRICRKEVYLDLTKHGRFGTYEWTPPHEIFGDKAAVREWLMAFFDGEAYVNVTNDKLRIQVKSANGRGLRLIRDLLDKHFGIEAKVYGPYHSNNEKATPYYQLEIIRKNSLTKYKKEIGFYSPTKKLKLDKSAGVAKPGYGDSLESC